MKLDDFLALEYLPLRTFGVLLGETAEFSTCSMFEAVDLVAASQGVHLVDLCSVLLKHYSCIGSGPDYLQSR